MTDEVLADATVLFSTSKPGGTGFGLPLVVKIVESEHEVGSPWRAGPATARPRG